jgi:hypothetical protein
MPKNQPTGLSHGRCSGHQLAEKLIAVQEK